MFIITNVIKHRPEVGQSPIILQGLNRTFHLETNVREVVVRDELINSATEVSFDLTEEAWTLQAAIAIINSGGVDDPQIRIGFSPGVYITTLHPGGSIVLTPTTAPIDTIYALTLPGATDSFLQIAVWGTR